MPQLSDYSSRDILAFGGAQTLPDPPDVRPPTGLYARNMEFIAGTAQTRRGFGPALSVNEAVTALHNWNSGLGNLVVWLKAGTGVKLVSLTGLKAVTGAANNGSGLIRLTATGHGLTTGHQTIVDRVGGVPAASGQWPVTVIDVNTIDLQGSTFAGTYTSGGEVGRIETVLSTTLGTGAVFMDAGARLYVALFNAPGGGAAGGWVVSKQNGVYVADALFPPPLTYVPGVLTEPGAGSVTAGLHRMGYIIESRGGHVGRPGPDSGTGVPSLLTFNPQFFTATGSKNAQWVLNPTSWPAWGVRVRLIMTPISDLNDWRFVPGASADLPIGGGAASKTITFDISDADLLAKGESAIPYLLLQTQTVAGVAPFNVSSVVRLGTRMGYVCTINDVNGNPVSALMVSDPGQYQAITPGQHLVQLPGQQEIVTVFSLGAAHFILGPHWTFATADTHTVPVEWPTPQLIDGRHGTTSVKGVDVSAAGDSAWVADQDGLYRFNGAYSRLPISYYQTADWNRINWTVPNAVSVLDDIDSGRVIVMAPLDAATTPSHLLVWNYSRGFEPELVDYSIYDLSGVALGSMAVVLNELLDQVQAAKRRTELWIGSSAAAPILRALTASDTLPYKDNGAAIHSTYDPALFPGKAYQRGVMRHHGAHIRVEGSGSLALTVSSMDGTSTATPTAITLSATPDAEILRRWILHSELARLRLDCSDGWFALGSIRWYFDSWVTQR